MNKSGVCALLVVASMLGACEFVGSALAPSATGGRAGSTAERAAEPAVIVPLDASQLGTPSGTSVGARIPQFHSDLSQLQQVAVGQVQRGRQLQADMDASIASYRIAVGSIGARQDGGGTPQDSAAAWQQAQTHLRTVSAILDQMNGLSGEVTRNVAYAAFLEQSIRDAGTAPDATPEDRRQLRVLEDSTARTSASLDQLLNGLRQDVLRESRFLGGEGAKLAQIAPPGMEAAANVGASPRYAAPTARAAGPAGAGLATGRPFVVIRFQDPDVAYEQQLYEAVSTALARSPNIAFDLVAAAPGSGTPEDLAINADIARASAGKVMRSLLDMGLPSDRISLSQLTDPNIQSNEVRLYVR